jgi:hypothetical protein
MTATRHSHVLPYAGSLTHTLAMYICVPCQNHTDQLQRAAPRNCQPPDKITVSSAHTTGVALLYLFKLPSSPNTFMYQCKLQKHKYVCNNNQATLDSSQPALHADTHSQRLLWSACTHTEMASCSQRSLSLDTLALVPATLVTQTVNAGYVLSHAIQMVGSLAPEKAGQQLHPPNKLYTAAVVCQLARQFTGAPTHSACWKQAPPTSS